MKTAQIWASVGLTPGFQKRVAGFDARTSIAPIEIQPPGIAAAKLIGIGTQRWRPATIEPQVWPRIASDARLSDCNGLNLFPTLRSAGNAVTSDTQGVLVAFEFPSGLIESVATTFGLDARPAAESRASWKFLGYDIVDIRTQSSAMYSFDWSRDEWIELAESMKFTFNQFGLVQEESVAIAQAVAFDEKVREHAPFAPCGVWACGRGAPG